MKRAGRIVYRLLSGLSLLLLVATAGVWVRSYWVSDWLHWDNLSENRSLPKVKDILCARGGMQFEAWRDFPERENSPEEPRFEYFHDAATQYPIYGDDFLRVNLF